MANELKHTAVGTQLTQAEFETVVAHVLDGQSTGDLPYASSATQLSRLAIGSTGYILSVVGGVPVWVPRDIGARAYHSVAQSIPNATWTTLSLDSESYDTDNIHDLVTNNGRLTCKTAGKYMLVGTIFYAANATGFRILTFQFNGTGTEEGHQNMNAVNGDVSRLTTSAIYNMAVNDYFMLITYQSSTAALNVTAYGFTMQRIG